MIVTREMLDDGGLLRSLIEVYNKSGDRKAYAMVFQCLRDSYVYVPCRIMVNNIPLHGIYEDDFDSNDEVEIVPDFLYTANQDKFFPVFSNKDFLPLEENLGLCGLRKHFLDVIDWVSSIRDVDGVLVDAFTNMFVCDVSYFPLIRELPSMIDESMLS